MQWCMQDARALVRAMVCTMMYARVHTMVPAVMCAIVNVVCMCNAVGGVLCEAFGQRQEEVRVGRRGEEARAEWAWVEAGGRRRLR